MDKNPPNKDETKSSSLLHLLKQYTTRVDERETIWKEGTRACHQQQKVQTDEIEKLKETVNILQHKPSSTSDTNQQSTASTVDEKGYKKKWEDAEAKCQMWEKKFWQLETGTIKQLQDKIDQLEQDYHQMKLIKESITEICSCRQLTNAQIEQLKFLVNNNNFSIDTIANKNDFHQQTIKLRSILATQNSELLNRLEEILNKKRKRDQLDDELTDDEDDEED